MFRKFRQDFCLLILKTDDTFIRHTFNSYDDMKFMANFLKVHPHVSKIKGLIFSDKQWIPVFRFD